MTNTMQFNDYNPEDVTVIKDKILVKRWKPKTKKGLIIIPESSQNKKDVHHGTVVSTGLGLRVSCKKCKGRGVANKLETDALNDNHSDIIDCKKCDGTGEITIQMQIKPGDHVAFSPWSGTNMDEYPQFMNDGEKYVIMRENQVHMVLSQKDMNRLTVAIEEDHNDRI